MSQSQIELEVAPESVEVVDAREPQLTGESALDAKGRYGSRGERTCHWMLLLGSSAVLSLSFVLYCRPDNDENVYVPLLNTALPGTCVARYLGGVDCPGCGMTRCFVSIAHGEFVRAFLFHPIGVLLFVAFAVQPPLRAVQLWRMYRGRPPLAILRRQEPLWALAILLVGYWIFKVAAQIVTWIG